jgi:hypothetical protein
MRNAPIATAIKPTADPAAMPPIAFFDKPLDDELSAAPVAELAFMPEVPAGVVVAFVIDAVAFRVPDGVAVGDDPT